MKILVDAANLRDGGGRTHLIELLTHFDHTLYPDVAIEVWASDETLELLPKRSCIVRKSHPFLKRNLFFRSFWQRFLLEKYAKNSACDIIFSPGGNYLGSFRPAVTMSRNMLPFEWREIFRYFPYFRFLKLILLRVSQSRSFKNVDGLIFLSNYAEKTVMGVVNSAAVTIRIPHGINERFLNSGHLRTSRYSANRTNEISLLYVSPIDKYKHQEKLIQALSELRSELQLPLKLVLVGSSYAPSLGDLRSAVKKFDPNCEWVDYRGAMPFGDLHSQYQECDIGIFASTCENLPNTLLEMMAAKMPIICSSYGPMPEILRDAGVYFNPVDVKSIKDALISVLESEEVRETISSKAFEYAQTYSWYETANKTIEFLEKIKGRSHSLKCKV